MFRKTSIAALLCTLGVAGIGSSLADDGRGIPSLDHVFVIMMENHGYSQIFQNPNQPYLNDLISSGQVNLATNYFAVAHPSLTNYLEVVGGSNFGILSDHAPAWHSSCAPNIMTGKSNVDGTPPQGSGIVSDGSSTICPITGSGMDAPTVAIDSWNEINPPIIQLANLDGKRSIAARHVEGETIADQLAAAGRSWKAYEESLPPDGTVDGVNVSNGTLSNLDVGAFNTLNAAAFPNGVPFVQAYAVKHNPFAYFASVQNGLKNGAKNLSGFISLFGDLATGDVSAYSFIAPNQCNDQHGQGAGDQFCQYDPGLDSGGNTYGTQAGTNPALIRQGDATLEKLVRHIKASPAWTKGRNAIVILWDENDYSGLTTAANPASPSVYPRVNQNTVVLTVETNYLKSHGVKSSTYYTHYSLLKTIEAGFGLSCLNHACDNGVEVMSDLFGGGDD